VRNFVDNAKTPLAEEGVKPMKIVFATACVLTAAALAACGGGGHSQSYDAGYKWASGNELAKSQAGMMGADTICHSWSTQQAQGLNAQEWIQGCEDALKKGKS
jgi:hypothetical protein